MLVTCWSVKGGSGTTVVAACLAATAARAGRTATLIVDLAGDVPAALGVDDGPGSGVTDWLRTSASASGPPGSATSTVAGLADLSDLEVRVDDHLSVLVRGSRDPGGSAISSAVALGGRLRADGRFVVVDAGTLDPDEVDPVARTIIDAADRSLLVTRACYLAMRHAARVPCRPDGVVLVAESGRSLGRADVASVVGAPVMAELGIEPQLARIVDAGLLCSRLPRGVERSMLELIGD